jgi:hypothetical protein
MGNNMPSEEKIHRAAAVIVKGDLGEQSLVDYLKSLLTTLWEEQDGFSGKRPFGNSGWQYDVWIAFIKAGLITGELDADGCVKDCDDKEGDALVLAVIKRMNVSSGEYKDEPMHQRMGL